MKSIRLAVFILLGILLLTGIPYFGYLLYQRYSKPDAKPLDAVPEKAALLIRINEPARLYEELNRSNLIWQEIAGYPGIRNFRTDLHVLDSVTNGDREIRRLAWDHPVYVVLTLTGRAEFGLMYLAEAGNAVTEETLKEFLQSRFPGKTTLVSSPYAETRVLRFQPEKMQKPWFMAVAKGVFIMSRHAALVKKAIDRLSLNYIPVSAAGFRSLDRSSGKKSDLNLFVNIPYLSLAAWKHASEESRLELVRIARFADWCGLDVILRRDEVLLNGFTVASDSTYHTLALYQDQEAGPVTVPSILPENVTSYTQFSMESLGRYLREIQLRERRLESPAEKGRLSRFNAARSLKAETYLLSWASNEICFATLEPEIEGAEPARLIAVRHDEPDSSIHYLKRLSHDLGLKTDSLIYDSCTIYLCDLTEPMNAVLGTFSPGIRSECYMEFRGFTLFARSPFHLVRLVNHVRSGTTLSTNKRYLTASENLASTASITWYGQPGYTVAVTPSLFSEPLASVIRSLADSLFKFESMTFQIINRKDAFYTSLSVRFNPDRSNEGPLAWQCPLDTLVTGRPRIVPTNRAGHSALLARDTGNTLYMIDSLGSILWKKRLYGRVLSDFHPITMRGSDSIYYLFNTENHLYLIRSDGETASRFPMKFPIRATNGLTVADYNQNHDYRILIAFRDNRVYNFTLEGMMVQGWELPSLPSAIRQPVEYLVHEHKDYLVIKDEAGHFMITDRRGRVRIKPSRPFEASPGGVFGVNRSGKKGTLLTTDKKGRIMLVEENGKLRQRSLGLFSPLHTFLYEDLTGNGIPDYILFDRNVLSVYNRSEKLIYRNRFLHDVPAPFILTGIPGKTCIGIASPATREIFLFDGNGAVNLDRAILGTTAFDIGPLENAQVTNLVIGNGKNLKCFRLTKF